MNGPEGLAAMRAIVATCSQANATERGDQTTQIVALQVAFGRVEALLESMKDNLIYTRDRLDTHIDGDGSGRKKGGIIAGIGTGIGGIIFIIVERWRNAGS